MAKGVSFDTKTPPNPFFPKMRLMIFLDLDNFRRSLFRRDKKRFYDFKEFQNFLIKYLNKELNFTKCLNESLIRTYAYTGQYPSNLLKRVKNKKKLEYYKRRMKAQEKFFEKIKDFNYFELKTLPLKYEDGKIFQKGIDVQMAVDLVYHAFIDNFDVVVLCSGDIDIKEAVKLVKSLGKRVIVVSHPRLASRELIKEADLFINIEKFKDEELNEFSNIKNLK